MESLLNSTSHQENPKPNPFPSKMLVNRQFNLKVEKETFKLEIFHDDNFMTFKVIKQGEKGSEIFKGKYNLIDIVDLIEQNRKRYNDFGKVLEFLESSIKRNRVYFDGSHISIKATINDEIIEYKIEVKKDENLGGKTHGTKDVYNTENEELIRYLLNYIDEMNVTKKSGETPTPNGNNNIQNNCSQVVNVSLIPIKFTSYNGFDYYFVADQNKTVAETINLFFMLRGVNLKFDACEKMGINFNYMGKNLINCKDMTLKEIGVMFHSTIQIICTGEFIVR